MRVKWSGAPRYAVLFLGLACAGCSRGSTNLAGHWRGVQSEGVDSTALDTANAYATHMRLDVKGDVLTVTTPKDTRTDHYTVVQEDKAKTVIASELDGKDDPQTFTFPDAKTMKWAVSPGASLVFVKE